MPTSRTVLITGATKGIGRHLALDLLARGHRVFATGRNAASLDSLSSEGKGIETVILDVEDEASIQRAAAEIEARTGGRGIDVLINNAGYGQAGPLLELDDKALRAQFETNVFGLMAVTRAFVPSMVDRRDGVVINISSTGGRITFPFFGAYHASKYAVEALSDALRMELAPFGVRVVLVEPGPVRSSFADRSIASLPDPIANGSRYAASYAKADAIRARTDRLAVGPEAVARVVRRAIARRRPRARYLVPALFFEIAFFLLGVLPTCAVDGLFRSMIGLRANFSAR